MTLLGTTLRPRDVLLHNPSFNAQFEARNPSHKDADERATR